MPVSLLTFSHSIKFIRLLLKLGWAVYFWCHWQNFHNNLSAYCSSGGPKENWTSAPLLGPVFKLWKMKTVTHTFWPVTAALAADDVTTGWLAVETSDMPCPVKLSSGDLTSWATPSVCMSQAETDHSHRWNFPLQSCPESLALKERATTNEMKHKLEQKPWGECAVEFLP